MRKITYIVIHCTATSQNATVASIQNYWRTVLNWINPGYHYLIERDGKINQLQPIERPSNGVAGHNMSSIHISYIGGINANGKPVDTRTPRQILSMLQVLIELKESFPDAHICGHRDFPGVKKDCPSFSVSAWMSAVGIDKEMTA